MAKNELDEVLDLIDSEIKKAGFQEEKRLN